MCIIMEEQQSFNSIQAKYNNCRTTYAYIIIKYKAGCIWGAVTMKKPS